MNDATSVENGAAAPADTQSVMPLFYSQPEVLRKDAHGDLALSGNMNFSFAKTANAIPVTVSEFPSAGLHFPIIFVGKENLTPVAIFGVQQGQNLFVDDQGQWDQLTYMPAYVRRYPFVFVRDEQQERYALCIDRASERIVANGDGAQAFFNGDEQSDLTKQALEFCTTYQKEAIQTERFSQLLKSHNLVEEKTLNLTLRSGSKIAINNIGLVDEQKLNNLPDEAFLELRKTGALAAIYCHLMSQKAWQPMAARA